MQFPDDYTTHVSSPIPPPRKPPATVNVWFVVLFAIIGLLVGAVLILAVELYRANENKPQTQEQPSPRQTATRAALVPSPTPLLTPAKEVAPVRAPPPPAPPPERHPLVPTYFRIPAGQYYSVQFNVTGNGHVTGWYSTDKDVIAVIVDAGGLQRVAQRGQGAGGNAYYSSGGRVSRGEIDVRLSPGTYYIVFSKQYALFLTTEMSAEIYLEQ